MYRYLSVLVHNAALMGPVTLMAQDRDRQDRDRQAQQQDTNQKGNRYYDKGRKDWHNWDENQNASFRQYLQEHHKRDHDFARANSRERAQYFQSLQQHQDSADRHR